LKNRGVVSHETGKTNEEREGSKNGDIPTGEKKEEGEIFPTLEARNSYLQWITNRNSLRVLKNGSKTDAKEQAL